MQQMHNKFSSLNLHNLWYAWTSQPRFFSHLMIQILIYLVQKTFSFNASSSAVYDHNAEDSENILAVVVRSPKKSSAYHINVE